MPSIKKLMVIVIVPLMFSNKVIAETDRLLDQNTNKKQQHELEQLNKIKDSNILAEEYFNIGRSFYKLGKYQEAIKSLSDTPAMLFSLLRKHIMIAFQLQQ